MSETCHHQPKKECMQLGVKKVQPLNAHTFLLTLGIDSAKAESYLPGQFFNLRPLPSTAPLLRRPISICDTRPEAGEIDFLIQRTGEGTSLLVQHMAGELLDVMGPLGNPFAPDISTPTVMIAGGVGVAPLYFLSRWMRRNSPASNPPPITFCYGARNKAGLVLLGKIEAAVSELVITTEDGSHGQKGFVTAAIEKYLSPDRQIYVCGPSPMMNAVLKMMREKDLEGQFSLENRMGCGVGACQGCVVPGRRGMIRVCCDGPVISSELIDTVYTE